MKAVAVVIPARNEEHLVGRCLDAVVAAVGHATVLNEVQVVIILVADACEDATAAVARGYQAVTVLEVGFANVGASRRTGVELALALADLPPDEVWIANTDADSVVPPTWISDQLRLAEQGAEVMVGTVRPFAEELSAERWRAWEVTRKPGVDVRNVHGANLGILAETYLSADGFASVTEHEDSELVARCVAADARVVATADIDVLTSGRLHGRTPGGYAGYLRDHLLPAAALTQL